MPIVRLKANWPGNFTRYARNAEGERVKALVFTPGVPTLVCDQDMEAIADDLGKCLEECPESEIVVHAHPGDANKEENENSQKSPDEGGKKRKPGKKDPKPKPTKSPAEESTVEDAGPKDSEPPTN